MEKVTFKKKLKRCEEARCSNQRRKLSSHREQQGFEMGTCFTRPQNTKCWNGQSITNEGTRRKQGQPGNEEPQTIQSLADPTEDTE